MQAKSQFQNLQLSLATQSKITSSHLNRQACVYVRLSTARQVQNNKESLIYQYQLAERAEALGWDKEMISVIDSELG